MWKNLRLYWIRPGAGNISRNFLRRVKILKNKDTGVQIEKPWFHRWDVICEAAVFCNRMFEKRAHGCFFCLFVKKILYKIIENPIDIENNKY